MTTRTTEVDYLVIGGGAMGTAFVDTVLTGDKKATFAIVDRKDCLAGHWNDSYDFVKLHQPALFYGVNSRKLGNGTTDLSSKSEILEYYAKILEDFHQSGRVEFLGEHEYLGENRAKSLTDENASVEFIVKRRVVNATFMGVEVPSTHAPKFDVSDDVPFVPLNSLTDEIGKWKNYCVLGCGKTGMDAIQYLLNRGVPASEIHWVISNDIWCFERAEIQVGKVMDAILDHCHSIIEAKTPPEIFTTLEMRGGILRVNQDATPTKWKCPTVSLEEINLMKQITNTIRNGRVKSISAVGIEFADETLIMPEDTLFVNCTADGLAKRAAVPLFEKGKVNLQPIFFCQQVFSAATIGALELCNTTDEKRNRITPVPHPEVEADWPHVLSNSVDNALKLQLFIPIWLRRSRLFYLSHEPLHKYVIYAIQAFLVSGRLRRAANRLSA
ncbi:NAD(P)/FAD-dependent oxidoreductase [Rhodobacteraceae bacterium Araon29]